MQKEITSVSQYLDIIRRLDKAYAKDGIDPWLERMAAVIRLLTQYAGIICWQTSDLSKTGRIILWTSPAR